MEKLIVIDLDNSAHHVMKAGLLFAYGSLAGLPQTLLKDAENIPDYRDGLKRPKAIRARVSLSGYQSETYPMPGGKYGLCCYPGIGNMVSPNPIQERRVVIAAMSGILNLRQHNIDGGMTAQDIDNALKLIS